MPGPQPYANALFRFTPLFTPHRREGQTFWLLAGEGFIPPVSLTPASLQKFSCKILFSAL